MHSHADFTLPSYPGRDQLARPGRDDRGHRQLRLLAGAAGRRSGAGRRAARRVPRARARTSTGRGGSFGEYLDRLDAAQPAVNAIPLVGHGMLRLAVVGAEDRPATAAELDRDARRRRRRRWPTGAWGMSTGLVYPPGLVRRHRRGRRGRRGAASRSTACTPATSATRTTAWPTRCTRRSRSAGGSASGSRCRTSRRPGGTTTVAPRRRWRSSTTRGPRACASTRTPTRTRPAARS